MEWVHSILPPLINMRGIHSLSMCQGERLWDLDTESRSGKGSAKSYFSKRPSMSALPAKRRISGERATPFGNAARAGLNLQAAPIRSKHLLAFPQGRRSNP